jgi:membrane protease YdiL (CAAX protease family)
MSTPDPIVTQEGQPGAGAPAPGPSDLGTGPERGPYVLSPLTWLDLFLLIGFFLLNALVLEIAVALIGEVVFHVPFAITRDPTPAQLSISIVAQALTWFATLGFLYTRVRLRTSLPFWPAIGWRHLRESAFVLVYIGLGVSLAFAAGIADRFVDNGKTLPIESLFHSRQTVLLLTGLGVLIAPFMEETLFRGCIFPVVARRFGTVAGVIATGVLFGLAHAEQLWGGWGDIGVLITVGIVLTYVRARAGTVLASYLVHLGYNTVLFGGFYYVTGGLRHFPGA